MTTILTTPTADAGIVIGTHTLKSRLIVGTGKYATFEQMQECLEISGADVITVAVRRERLVDADGRNILDFQSIYRNTRFCRTLPGVSQPKTLSGWLVLAGKFCAALKIRVRIGSSWKCSVTQKLCCRTLSQRSMPAGS